MKTAKYALAVALGLIALAAPKATWANSVNYDFTGTLTFVLRRQQRRHWPVYD